MRRALVHVSRRFAAAGLIAFGLALACCPRPAAAQNCSQLAQYLQYYQQQNQQLAQWYQQNCPSSQYCSTVVQDYQHNQQVIAYIQQLESNNGCNSNGDGSGDDPCATTRNYIQAQAQQYDVPAYNWVNAVLSQYYVYFQRGYVHGFYFIYDTPPVYCTDQPQNYYQRAPRTYYSTYDQSLRVISQFYNNGYRIVGYGVW
jgi:hypothetical protein